MAFRPVGALPTVTAHWDFYPCPTQLLTVCMSQLGQARDQHRSGDSLAAAPSSRRQQEWRQIFPNTEGI